MGLPLETFVALRYLRPGRAGRAVSGVGMIAIAGTAVGVAALVVVMSVMGGFTLALRDKIVGANAHAHVVKITFRFKEYQEITEKIRTLPSVAGASPFILREGIVAHDHGVAGVLLKGIDPATARQVGDIQAHLDRALDEAKKAGYIINLDESSRRERPTTGRPPERVRHLIPEAAPSFALERLADPDALRMWARDLPPPFHGEATTARERRRRDSWTKQRAQALPGVIIGRELALRLDLAPGEDITLINPIGSTSEKGPEPSSRPFRIAGVFHSGMYEFDMKFVYISLTDLRAFLEGPDEASGVEVRFREADPTRTSELAAQLAQSLGGFPYKVRDWREMNRNLFSALELEKRVVFLILCVIVMVAAFGIGSTLLMLGMQRRREIAVLKTLGLPSLRVAWIFLQSGLILGALGTAAGVALGLVLCGVIAVYPLEIHRAVYYMQTLPVRVDMFDLLGVVGAALLIATLCATLPALHAATMRPVDALRKDHA